MLRSFVTQLDFFEIRSSAKKIFSLSFTLIYGSFLSALVVILFLFFALNVFVSVLVKLYK